MKVEEAFAFLKTFSTKKLEVEEEEEAASQQAVAVAPMKESIPGPGISPAPQT